MIPKKQNSNPSGEYFRAKKETWEWEVDITFSFWLSGFTQELQRYTLEHDEKERLLREELSNHVYYVNLSQTNGPHMDVVNHCSNLFTGWDIDDLECDENTAKDSDTDDEW